jgi:hypothetical protein
MPAVEEVNLKGCIGGRKTYVVDNNLLDDCTIESNTDSKTSQLQRDPLKRLAREMHNACFDPFEFDRKKLASIRQKTRRIERFSAIFQQRSTIVIVHEAVMRKTWQ